MKEIKTYALNDSQMGVYLDQINDLNTTKYNIPVMRKYSRLEIDIDKLILATTKAIESSDIIHYSFDEIDGIPTMIRNDDINFEVKHLCLREEEIDKALLDFVKPFNLKDGNLVHASIIETLDNVYLLLDCHHIISDGTSIKLIIDRIDDLYHDREVKDSSYLLSSKSMDEQEESYKEIRWFKY